MKRCHESNSLEADELIRFRGRGGWIASLGPAS